MSGIISMSMSLAEGIVNRDLRTLKKRTMSVPDLYVAMSLPHSRRSGSKRVKYFEELLKSFRGYSVSEAQFSKKRRYSFILWEINEWDGLDRVDVTIKKNTIEVTPVCFGVTFHALARILYRRNLMDLESGMVELNYHLEMHPLVVSQVVHSNSQKNVRTANGFFISKIMNDGCIRAVTWVDEAKGGREQLEHNSNLYTTIRGLAESRGLTVQEYLQMCIRETEMGAYKSFRNGYIKDGGDVDDVEAMAAYYERRIIEISKEVAESEEPVNA
ncbi:hypothetical protein pVa21_094 [Vibrio phage pVa-21]|nr:hypothetical protein pVa21_094 [Vibrio phage pVa-21]